MTKDSASGEINNFLDYLVPGRGKLPRCFDNVTVKNIRVLKKSKSMEIGLFSPAPIERESLEKMEKIITEEYQLEDVSFIIEYDLKEDTDASLLECWEEVVAHACKNDPGKRILLKDSQLEISENTLLIRLKTQCREVLSSNGFGQVISRVVSETFNKDVRVKFLSPEKEEEFEEQYALKKQHLEDEALKRAMADIPKEPVKGDSLILGKRITGRPVAMDTVTLDSGNVTVRGEVLSINFRELRNDRYLCTFNLTDKTNSLTCKFFLKRDKYPSMESSLKEGENLYVTGEVQYDKYDKDMSLMAKSIEKTEGKLLREDGAPIKRVELHLHTKMSAMDGITEVEELIKRAHLWGHKAIAITDHGVVQAYPGASEIGEKLNIKIIYGVEGYLVNDDMDYTKATSYHFIILAKNKLGLKNLYKLISRSHIDTFYKRPRMTKAMVNEHREGLLIGTACEAGELYRAHVEKWSMEQIMDVASFYDYFEIQPLGNNRFLVENQTVAHEGELKKINADIVDLGKAMGKPVVATCDVHFLDPEDEVFRRILMAGQGYTDADNQAPLYFRTTQEMLDEFSYLGDGIAHEVVVKNSNLINDMIENIAPMPEGTFPPKIEGAEEEIKEMSLLRASQIYSPELHPIVEQRLNQELNSIITNGFAVMYLIASKIVQKSLADGYLVGSRGSVGSSLVAYLTGITEVNPLPAHYVCEHCQHTEFFEESLIDCGQDLPEKPCPRCGQSLKKDGYDIPFETFLGFEGDKEPDIDLNFSGEYQSIAHRYVEELFDKENVFRAGTINSLADKTAFGFVKGYLDERGDVVTNAELLRLVKGLTGIKKTTGQHPGGVMIIPEDMEIYDFTPIQKPADDTKSEVITTHFDYDFLHGSILKLDILGHDDPTIIKMLEDLTGIDARTIPIGDEKTMELFSSTEVLGISPEDINSEVATFGIPEFGTKFVRHMLIDTKPKTMSELIRISGLSHGTDVWVNNAKDLIKNKTATLSEVISTRDDIMLFLIHGGLPPYKAFKIMEDVRKGKGLTYEYEKLMKENDVPSWYIDSCRKIKYMFPKAHAAAYVMMAFRIAWFKVNFPIEFYAAYFSVKGDEFDAGIMTKGLDRVRETIFNIEGDDNNLTQKEKNVVTLLEVVVEMHSRGIFFLNVDLYKSHGVNFLIEDGKLRPPLKGIPGLSGAAALRLAKERITPFTSVEDLRIRGKLSKSVIEALEEQGCLESLPESSQISFFT